MNDQQHAQPTTPLLPARAQSYEDVKHRVIEYETLDNNRQPVVRRDLLETRHMHNLKGWTRQH